MSRRLTRIGAKTLKLFTSELEHVAFEAFEWNVKKWAAKAGVCPQTIYRLMSGRTRFVQLETIVKLSNAVHMDIVSAEAGTVQLRSQHGPEDIITVSDKREVTITPIS